MDSAPHSSSRGLARFAWGVLAYNVLVILWGAFVRATGSGAGCGRHWPLCNGEVVPHPKSVATLIEVTHRATSGVALVLVVALLVWAVRALPKGHRARRAAAFSTAFIFGEALIGGGLVLFELVAHDASMKRALSTILHLGNTFLLLGALAVTAWVLTREGRAGEGSAGEERAGEARAGEARAVDLPRRGLVNALLAVSLGSVLVLGATGSIAALGDTLFPAESLRQGLAQDVSPAAHLFLRLRMLHPIFAVTLGGVVVCAANVLRVLRPAPRVRRLAAVVAGIFCLQVVIGLVNVALLAPVGVQLLHLLGADATWIALVLLACEVWLARDVDYAPSMSRKGPGPSSDVPPSTSNVDPVT